MLINSPFLTGKCCVPPETYQLSSMTKEGCVKRERSYQDMSPSPTMHHFITRLLAKRLGELTLLDQTSPSDPFRVPRLLSSQVQPLSLVQIRSQPRFDPIRTDQDVCFCGSERRVREVKRNTRGMGNIMRGSMTEVSEGRWQFLD